MASPEKPPVSWDHWKGGNENFSPPPVELWLEYTADVEEAPLPAAVDKRESDIYTVTNDHLTGKPHLDSYNKQLAKDYNTIAMSRRDIIRRLYRLGRTECKGIPKAMSSDVSRVRCASLQVKNNYRELRRMGGRPVPYPGIFDESIKAPLF